MKRTCLFALLALAAGALPSLDAASPDPQKTRELVAVVQSGAPLEERARALQQLALVATRDAVPAASALLGDEKLGQYARDVLEGMPDPAAGEALRAALGRLTGNPQIGVVNSLGLRRDGQAVAALRALATNPASAAAGPALLALGRIGSPEAVAVIDQALERGPAGTRAAAAEANLLVADRLAREGAAPAAVAIYDRIRRAELPEPLRITATRGAILARGAGGVALLLEQLRSPGEAARDVALLTAREARDPSVTPALVAALDSFPAPQQALLLAVLVDRADGGALAAIEARARSGPEEVRVAALRALGRMGRASSVPILVQVATAAPGGAAAEAALASLARISVPEAEAALRQALPAADTALRVKLIGVLGDRRAEAAAPELMRLAAGTDSEVAKAACRALGLLARPADLPKLIALAIAVPDDAVKSLADRAIVTTAMKILEPRRRAEAVLAAFRQAPDPATKAALVRPLGAIVRSMGGSHEAFFALRAALRDPAVAVRDAALAALADWPDAAPTTTLLELVRQKDATPAQREVALRGAMRMATNVAAGRERSPLNVLDAFQQAGQSVRSREEKLMLVSGLGHLKRPEAVALLQPYLDDPAVQAEAALAVVQVAPALGGGRGNAELRLMLEKIAAREKDEGIREKAARLAKGAGPAQPAKGKGKGKAAPIAPAAGPAPFFNGRDLAGWDGDPGVWRIRDGVIVGGSPEGNPRNEFLAAAGRHRNFVLRLEYRLVGSEGFVNGGVQFRSVRIAQPPNEMSGYQADIGAGHSGCLYDESRRKKFLARAPDDQIKQLEKPGEWNRYEIRCEGARIELSLNGTKTITYTEEDATVAGEGLIALQIHGNCKAEIQFRGLVLEALP